MAKKTDNTNQEIFDNEFLIKTLVGTQSALDGIVKDSERKTALLNSLSDSIIVVIENLKTIKDKVSDQDFKIHQIENQLRVIAVHLDGIQEKDILVSNNHIHLKELKYAVQTIRDKVNILAFQEEGKKNVSKDNKFSFFKFTLGIYEGIKNVKAILLLIALILSIIAYFFGADLVGFAESVLKKV